MAVRKFSLMLLALSLSFQWSTVGAAETLQEESASQEQRVLNPWFRPLDPSSLSNDTEVIPLRSKSFLGLFERQTCQFYCQGSNRCCTATGKCCTWGCLTVSPAVCCGNGYCANGNQCYIWVRTGALTCCSDSRCTGQYAANGQLSVFDSVATTTQVTIIPTTAAAPATTTIATTAITIAQTRTFYYTITWYYVTYYYVANTILRVSTVESSTITTTTTFSVLATDSAAAAAAANTISATLALPTPTDASSLAASAGVTIPFSAAPTSPNSGTTGGGKFPTGNQTVGRSTSSSSSNGSSTTSAGVVLFTGANSGRRLGKTVGYFDGVLSTCIMGLIWLVV